jgi:hypothetical protein
VSSAVVVLCALEMLGRSAERFPRIRVLEERPAGISSNADDYAEAKARIVYLIAAAPSFRLARSTQSARSPCGNRRAVKVVASILVHEEWHLKHDANEKDAYLAQLTTLNQLRLGPGTPEYAAVQRTMLSVIGKSP